MEKNFRPLKEIYDRIDDLQLELAEIEKWVESSKKDYHRAITMNVPIEEYKSEYELALGQKETFRARLDTLNWVLGNDK